MRGADPHASAIPWSFGNTVNPGQEYACRRLVGTG